MTTTEAVAMLIRAQIAMLAKPTTAAKDYAAKVMLDVAISRVAGR
jgi:hypothetical protein